MPKYKREKTSTTLGVVPNDVTGVTSIGKTPQYLGGVNSALKA